MLGMQTLLISSELSAVVVIVVVFGALSIALRTSLRMSRDFRYFPGHKFDQRAVLRYDKRKFDFWMMDLSCILDNGIFSINTMTNETSRISSEKDIQERYRKLLCSVSMVKFIDEWIPLYSTVL